MIRFEEIINKNIWKVCMLEPFEEQKGFVADDLSNQAQHHVKNEVSPKVLNN